MMGGFGSGDWADVSQRKTTTELCMTISASNLNKNGFFAKNKSGVITWTNDFSEVIGTANIRSLASGDGNKTCIEVTAEGLVTGKQRIGLTTTPCNYGGVRWWFECPLTKDGVYCGNRVTKLLLPPAGKCFGCRQCHELTYESCQKSHKYDRIIDHIPDDLDLEGLNLTQVLRLSSL